MLLSWFDYKLFLAHLYFFQLIYARVLASFLRYVTVINLQVLVWLRACEYVCCVTVCYNDHNFHPRKLTWSLKNTCFFVTEKWSSCNRWSTIHFWGAPSHAFETASGELPPFLPSQAAAEHYPGMRWRRTDLCQVKQKNTTRRPALKIHMDIWKEMFVFPKPVFYAPIWPAHIFKKWVASFTT